MKGIIVVNAYIKNSSQISQATRIKEELEKYGVEIEIVKNFCLAEIRNGAVVAENCSFCVFLDKDKTAARMLEKSGVKLFNSASAIEVCDNKMLTHVALADFGIDMPDCVYAPLCYYGDAPIPHTFVQAIGEKLGFPLVAKKCYGSLGAGVFLIRDEMRLAEFERENKLCEHFYQKFIDCGRGEDVRAIVIGGKYACAMKRVNDHDFRSNIELGGRGINFRADEQIISLCEKVAKILKLDYCGIDILTDKQGKRYVCEVNSNAFFAAAERVCNMNIAKKYAEWILSEVERK